MFPWDTDPEDLVKTLEAEGCEQIFIDQLSPRRIGRPELEKMLRELCRGDVLVIEEFSRLGRSLRELLELVARIADAGAVLVSRKENLDTSTETGRAMLSMLLALNHFRFDLMAPNPAKKESTRERAGKPVRPEGGTMGTTLFVPRGMGNDGDDPFCSRERVPEERRMPDIFGVVRCGRNMIPWP